MGDFPHQEEGWETGAAPSKRRLPAAIAVLVLIVAATGVAVWWLSRGPSDADIATQLKASVQHELATGQMSEYRLQVADVSVIRVVGNQYKGIADIRTTRGALHQVALDVTADGDRVFWQTSPGAFFFVIQEQSSAVGG